MTECPQRRLRHPFFNDDRDDSVHDDAGDDHVNDDKNDDIRSDLASAFLITSFSCDRVSPEDAQTPFLMKMLLMVTIYI